MEEKKKPLNLIKSDNAPGDTSAFNLRVNSTVHGTADSTNYAPLCNMLSEAGCRPWGSIYCAPTFVEASLCPGDKQSVEELAPKGLVATDTRQARQTSLQTNVRHPETPSPRNARRDMSRFRALGLLLPACLPFFISRRRRRRARCATASA